MGCTAHSDHQAPAVLDPHLPLIGSCEDWIGSSLDETAVADQVLDLGVPGPGEGATKGPSIVLIRAKELRDGVCWQEIFGFGGPTSGARGVIACSTPWVDRCNEMVKHPK